jgi:hypothetical protein
MTEFPSDQKLRQFVSEFNEAQQNQFIQVCVSTQLDPYRKQIYAVNRAGRGQMPNMSIVVAIDGLRSISARSGKYQGQVGPFWCGTDMEWKEVWIGGTKPAACKVGILHKDFTEPLWAVATQEQHWGSGPMWNKMGPHMLGIRAEAFAHRRAFPNETSGLFVPEEIEEPAPEAPPGVEDSSTPPVMSMKERALAAVSRGGHSLKTGADIPAPPSEIATFTDEEVDGWMQDLLESVDKTHDDLRADMKKVPGLDHATIDSDPTMWPVDWKPRIEKWVEKHVENRGRA